MDEYLVADGRIPLPSDSIFHRSNLLGKNTEELTKKLPRSRGYTVSASARSRGRKRRHIWEFGDFQTPPALARQVIELLTRLGMEPKTVIEPTCGQGAFVLAAAEQFKRARVVGVEINPDYLEKCRNALSHIDNGRMRLVCADFFAHDWDGELAGAEEAVLVLGNPPWVTNSDLGHLQSRNLPEKSNFQGRKGFDALTGKSNFDLSEWMLLRHLDWMKGRRGAIAMLCKTAVARKTLAHAWRVGDKISRASIYKIDALEHFNASVDACLFVMTFDYRSSTECAVYGSLPDREPEQIIGYHDGAAISDILSYRTWSHVGGGASDYVWRSGLKHDCSKVMELKQSGRRYVNGLGRAVDLEDSYVFPMLKSSDLGNGRTEACRVYTIVTQRSIGEDTSAIAIKAPLTWRYLRDHAEFLDRRGSAIYRGRPRFSIFGVGDYSFSPWKVAISGFYKRLDFLPVGPIGGREAMFDDTVYFLSCCSREEATFVASLLNSDPAQHFLNALIYWPDKRPITIELLKRLDLRSVAQTLGLEEQYLANLSLRRQSELGRRAMNPERQESLPLSI
jgi:hypothetical protein